MNIDGTFQVNKSLSDLFDCCVYLFKNIYANQYHIRPYNKLCTLGIIVIHKEENFLVPIRNLPLNLHSQAQEIKDYGFNFLHRRFDRLYKGK